MMEPEDVNIHIFTDIYICFGGGKGQVYLSDKGDSSL